MRFPFPSPKRWLGDRGTAMAEFVIAFPVFLVILVGVVDLGVNFGDGVQVGQGAKSAVEAAATSDLGITTHCHLATNVPMATLTERLMCMTKAATHLDPSTVRVKIFYETENGQPTTDYQPVDPNHGSDVTMVLCVMSPERSVTGMLAGVFNRRAHTTRVTARMGVPVKAAKGRYPSTAAEQPLTGQNWSFCRSDDPNLV